MPTISLTTLISEDIQVCFDLARSIDLHQISTITSNERAIAGKTEGLIELDEYVTWRATHFGITQKLTSKITQFRSPVHFRDEQITEIFNSIIHDHFFEQVENGVLMTDKFAFESPFGVIGHIFNRIVLNSYLTKLLVERNRVIKDFAESGKWNQILNRST